MRRGDVCCLQGWREGYRQPEENDWGHGCPRREEMNEEMSDWDRNEKRQLWRGTEQSELK